MANASIGYQHCVGNHFVDRLPFVNRRLMECDPVLLCLYHQAILSRMQCLIAVEFVEVETIRITDQHQVIVHTINARHSIGSTGSAGVDPNFVGAIPVVNRIDEVFELIYTGKGRVVVPYGRVIRYGWVVVPIAVGVGIVVVDAKEGTAITSRVSIADVDGVAGGK